MNTLERYIDRLQFLYYVKGTRLRAHGLDTAYVAYCAPIFSRQCCTIFTSNTRTLVTSSHLQVPHCCTNSLSGASRARHYRASCNHFIQRNDLRQSLCDGLTSASPGLLAEWEDSIPEPSAARWP